VPQLKVGKLMFEDLITSRLPFYLYRATDLRSPSNYV